MSERLQSTTRTGSGALNREGATATTLIRCSICEELKPINEFPRRRDRKSGVYTRCKLCNVKRNRRYAERNLEKERQRAQDYRAKNRDQYRLRRRGQKERRRFQENVGQIARNHTKIAERCVYCGSTENLERHHSDYAKPLEVVTVCVRCHQRLHHSGLVLEVAI